MNQVLINAVDLETMVQEIKDLNTQIADLKKMLVAERARVTLLEAEVAWVENGYASKEKRSVLDSAYPDGDGYWREK